MNIIGGQVRHKRRFQIRKRRKKLIGEILKIMSVPCNTFIDLFAGCGGLSLGLMNAGWKGLFAVEKEKNAFETLRHNLIDRSAGPHYTWPSWLEHKPNGVNRLIKKYRKELISLRGKVDLIAGGPPCQGYSLAGRRRKGDPRNKLFLQYIEFVMLVQPRMVLIENVKGITIEFGKNKRDLLREKARGRRPKSFADRIKETLERTGFAVFPSFLKAVEFGVPQLRPRYFLVGVRRDVLRDFEKIDFYGLLNQTRIEFLQEKGLPVDRHLTAGEALSDLEIKGKKLIDCVDSPRFRQIEYSGPQTPYQRLIHGSMNGAAPNSLRLANHKENTVSRFRQILNTCRPGVSLSNKDRARLGLGKHCVVALDPKKPSHTLTTLPDDIIHYSEPRILTVRECARLQSFPDWFEFKGKYTTGGENRVRECPRYTQVGNAVPPFLAEAIGKTLIELHRRNGSASYGNENSRDQRKGNGE